jgi:hypothetical protein
LYAFLRKITRLIYSFTAPSQGIRQIKDKGYIKKYEGMGKKIYHVAFAFIGRDDIEMEFSD